MQTTYRDVWMEVVCWDSGFDYHGKRCAWNGYMYIDKSKVIGKYKDWAYEIPWHGGTTFYYEYEKRIQIGNDWRHLGDEDRIITPSHVAHDVMNGIDWIIDDSGMWVGDVIDRPTDRSISITVPEDMVKDSMLEYV